MIRIKTALRVWSPDIDILVLDIDGQHTRYVSNIELTSLENNNTVLDPTFTLTREHAQELMDGLWQCGLRPSEGSGSAGALAATQKHLEDMRKLVFEKK